ncbi:MAG: pilus assembly protein PilM [Planctomycetota bacterium]
MAFGINKTRISPIAIDFGGDTLKVMQVQVSAEGVQLVAAGSAVVPEKARVDPATRMSFVAEALRDLLKQQPFKGRRAICGIPAFQTMVNTFELAGGEADDIDAQVNLHIQTVLGKDPSRLVIRNQFIDKVIRDGATRQRVLCIAAPRNAVMRYIELASQLKLEVVGMHSETMCIARPFIELYNRREEDLDTRMFVDIGSAATKIVVLHEGHITFARTLRAAGDELTHTFAKENGLDFAEARLARMRNGAEAFNPDEVYAKAAAGDAPANSSLADSTPLDSFDLDLDEDQSTPADTGLVAERRQATVSFDPAERPELLSETLDELVEGMSLTLNYLKSACPDRPVTSIVLLGGESRQSSVSGVIARSTGLPTFVGDPLARVVRTPGVQPIGLDMKQPQPGWAVPLGLCLSEANL